MINNLQKGAVYCPGIARDADGWVAVGRAPYEAICLTGPPSIIC